MKNASSMLPRSLSLLLSAVALAVLSACGGGSDSPAVTPASFKTLDGAQPLVIAHRGASGYRPEETIEAYTLAIEMGADVIEPDLMLTKDGVLVARHDVTLNDTTNVATKAEFASRKRAGENGDGEAVAADWFISDFTLAELKTLRARGTSNHPTAKTYDDLFQIATFEEVLQLRAAKSTSTGRTIAVYPETKNPSYHLALTTSGAIKNADGTATRMEDEVLRLINKYSLNSKTAPIFVQSFEPTSLQYLRSKGSLTKQVQLIDAYDVDFKTGKMMYGTSAAEKVYSQPTDWKLAGKSELFDTMLTSTGLAAIKLYADGIGPWKPMVVPVKCTLDTAGNCTDLDGDGKVTGYQDALSQTPTTLVTDAHKAGLFVHEYTFRNERNGYYNLTKDMLNDPINEYLLHLRLGVDGVFSDQSDTAVAARAAYLKELGR